MNTVDYIILGGNLASLVCAKELGERGKSVALVASPAAIGGHFSENQTLGFGFDLGMVLLEFDSYRDQKSDIALYNENVLGDAGHFSEAVENYVARYVESKRVSGIYVSKNQKLVNDYYISNNLTGLSVLFSSEDKDKIKIELRECVGSTDCHPREKASGEVFDGLSFHECSVKNHGPTLHREIFEPLTRKVTNLVSDELLAKYHRLFWAPIFYPETLLQSLSEKESALKPTEFRYPKKGNIAQLAQGIFRDINKNRNVMVLDSISGLAYEEGSWTDKEGLQSKKIISSLPQSVLAKIVGAQYEEQDKSSYALVFVKVQGSFDFEIIFNADENYKFFRLINSSNLSEKEGSEVSFLIIEYNYDYVGGDEFFDQSLYRQDLSQFFADYGIDRAVKIISDSRVLLKNKLVFPTLNNINVSKSNTEKLGEIDDLVLMGPSLGMGASSMNDQIIQALKFVNSEVEEL